MDLQIIPECFVDTNLVETLVPTKRGYNHQKGCGTVARVMINKLPNDFALGIIDRDKQELDYAKEFIVISAKGNVELMKHKTRIHFLIRIVGGMESFLLQSAAATAIDPQVYSLPADIASFREESKTEQSKKDYRFTSFFKAIRNAGHPDFLLLAEWINYLKQNPYTADLNILKTM